jgi:hypothetical protein
MKRSMQIGLLIAVVLALTGCATQQRYQWGGYDELLYQGYKDPNKMEAMRAALETHIAAMEKANQKVAPGLYAELGTLYLQKGDSAKALALYAKERDMWPESKGLMTAMITNIERRQASNGAPR